jgi:uncharacterized protein (TIGR00369 family)
MTTTAPPLTTRPVLEKLRAVVRGEMPLAPVAGIVGFSLTAVAEERATIEMEAGPQHANPLGTLHGGILCDIADAAMGLAYASMLAEGETFTTIELKINFLKPVWTGKLRAEGRVIKRGRTVGLVESDVFDTKGSLVARASSTCMTLRGGEASGR